MKIKNFYYLITSVFLLLPVVAFADFKSGLNTASSGAGFATNGDLATYITSAIKTIIGFVALLFIIMIITAGFRWMTAGGNKDSIEKAKTTIKNAIIGVVVVMLSYVIVNTAYNIIQGQGADDSGESQVSCDPACIPPQVCQNGSCVSG